MKPEKIKKINTEDVSEGFLNLRNSHNHSQTFSAGFVGRYSSVISKIESGDLNITLSNFADILSHYDMTLYDFFMFSRETA
jgi:predicted transcriptional regulator